MSEEAPRRANPEDTRQGGREPIFLLPGVVTALIGIMVAIHLASTLVLNQEGYGQLIFWTAFLHLRIVAAEQNLSLALPLIWTPFTHALLHGGWDHLLIN